MAVARDAEDEELTRDAVKDEEVVDGDVVNDVNDGAEDDEEKAASPFPSPSAAPGAASRRGGGAEAGRQERRIKTDWSPERKKSPLPDWLRRTWELGSRRILFTLNLEEEAPLENIDVMKLHSTGHGVNGEEAPPENSKVMKLGLLGRGEVVNG
ncbi:unnamed protein product [Miscanthus lutarioriparius]|uniref:Uncharacterized protein n=1 Tax=Miscanthus lutarioriparius TaxID=422564 RepID=A0A811PIN6_9POAL|nr:unnamed protein product [Miscanthus lutarioriparius]